MLQPKRKENELGCSISKLNFSNILQSPQCKGIRISESGKFFSWNLKTWALEFGIQPKESMQNPTNDWNLVTRIRNP